ncbi:MAG: hypothetical protein PHG30_06125, partial [Eubacteriales bacterium]|nr:hypothetical protein [Eubacteriales bacterium]
MAYPLIRNRHSCVARLILACLAALAVGCFCVERVAPAGVGGSACAKTFPLAAAGRPAAAKVATAEESGGVTYDFTAITERRFPIPKIGDAGNLVDAEPFFDDPWGNERKAWGKYVTLPTYKGARFRLSFWYKMRHTKGELGYAFIFYYNRDPETGKLRARDDVKASYSHYDVWVLQNEWSDWNRFTKEFTAPEGPDTVKIVIRIDGQGDLEYVDPSLVAVDATAKKP